MNTLENTKNCTIICLFIVQVADQFQGHPPWRDVIGQLWQDVIGQLRQDVIGQIRQDVVGQLRQDVIG